MRAGLPMISSDTEGMRSLIKKEVNGYILDSTEVANQINNIFENEVEVVNPKTLLISIEIDFLSQP